jgi:hypothetical protein
MVRPRRLDRRQAQVAMQMGVAEGAHFLFPDPGKS